MTVGGEPDWLGKKLCWMGSGGLESFTPISEIESDWLEEMPDIWVSTGLSSVNVVTPDWVALIVFKNGRHQANR